MKRYFVHLAYKGTNYHGWQIQPNASTVQETLNNAFSVILRKDINLTGCGRTDTGVHARQFYAHFDFHETIDDRNKIVYKTNCFLPDDIVVYSIEEVDNDLHARFSAQSREYKYYISQSKNIFETDYCWQLYYNLDIDEMNRACKRLFSHHDFTSFSKLHTDVKTNNCSIIKAEWIKEGESLVFTIEADRFLRNMVRSIVGTLIDVGLGKLSVEGFNAVIEEKDRKSAGTSVPAKGLFLHKIKYPRQVK